MASVTLNGVTYTDDNDPSTGLGGGGHRARFIPLLANLLTHLSTLGAGILFGNTTTPGVPDATLQALIDAKIAQGIPAYQVLWVDLGPVAGSSPSASISPSVSKSPSPSASISKSPSSSPSSSISPSSSPSPTPSASISPSPSASISKSPSSSPSPTPSASISSSPSPSPAPPMDDFESVTGWTYSAGNLAPTVRTGGQAGNCGEFSQTGDEFEYFPNTFTKIYASAINNKTVSIYVKQFGRAEFAYLYYTTNGGTNWTLIGGEVVETTWTQRTVANVTANANNFGLKVEVTYIGSADPSVALGLDTLTVT